METETSNEVNMEEWRNGRMKKWKNGEMNEEQNVNEKLTCKVVIMNIWFSPWNGTAGGISFFCVCQLQSQLLVKTDGGKQTNEWDITYNI